MILGQGDSSPLYRHVYKEKGLVHAISASNFTPVDRGFFEIAAVLSKNVESVIRAVWEEIRAIQRKDVTKQELEKAKRQVLSEYLFSHQRASHVAYAQATDEAFTGDHQFSEKYVAAIRNVTAGDIRRVANQYLIEPALTVVILKPWEEKFPVGNVPQAQIGEVQKYVLDNGLTILFKGRSHLADRFHPFILAGRNAAGAAGTQRTFDDDSQCLDQRYQSARCRENCH